MIDNHPFTKYLTNREMGVLRKVVPAVRLVRRRDVVPDLWPRCHCGARCANPSKPPRPLLMCVVTVGAYSNVRGFVGQGGLDYMGTQSIYGLRFRMEAD